MATKNVADRTASAPAHNAGAPANLPNSETSTGSKDGAESNAGEDGNKPPIEGQTGETDNKPEAKTDEKPESKTDEKPEVKVFSSAIDQFLSTARSRSGGGTKIRADVGYTLNEDGLKKLAKRSIPEQMKVILTIINRQLTPDKPVVTEPELYDLIVGAHGVTLKTKQDPWHIFRYYRTRLTTDGVLRSVTVEVPKTEPAPAETKAA